MDIKIQGIYRYEATRQILTFNKNVVIIAQTAYIQVGDRGKAIPAGFNYYTDKTLNFNLLLD